MKEIEDFKNRKIKAKQIFYIKEIDKNTSYNFVKKYHYLGEAKFFCCKAYGLFLIKNNELVGVATYSLPQGIATLKGWFSLGNDTKNIFELSRLCLLPALNGTNATSYLLSNSINELKKKNNEICRNFKKENKIMRDEDWECRAIITLACSERHVGSIYQICNFKYYGLTKKASDFYREDGKINPRGKSGSFKGVYLPRARKHRYAYILDETLKIDYKEEEKPKISETLKLECCNGSKKVYDPRYDKWYTCPRCLGTLKVLKDGVLEDTIIEQEPKKEHRVQTTIFDYIDEAI